MGCLPRRAGRVLLVLIMTAVLTLGSVAATSASSPQVVDFTTFSVHATNIVVEPGNTWQPFAVRLTAYQFAQGSFGFISVKDRKSNVRIFGSINTLVAVDNGYQFAGCGWASGSVSGKVCFTGAGISETGGNLYDFFSIIVVSGGSYSIGGIVPAGSVQISQSSS